MKEEEEEEEGKRSEKVAWKEKSIRSRVVIKMV